MSRENKMLHLALCWHMHQPDYRNYVTGEYVLPWTYLHAIKDYTDMAYHLEKCPGAKAVFNFVPVLIEQIRDYEDQFSKNDIRDPLLKLLCRENLDHLDAEEREHVFSSCFKSNHTKMVKPYPAYSRLYESYKLLEAGGVENLNYLSGQYLGDLLVWYHLAWTGESVRRTCEPVARLMAKASQFTYADRMELFKLIGELIKNIIPRYRMLAETGQIEISSTPYSHPILPLLLDFNAARESMPDVALPGVPRYPGGRTRAQAHITHALEFHKENFGAAPYGMWPAEGGLSKAALMLFADNGCKWNATGEAVLVNSFVKEHGHLPPKTDYLYKPYKISEGDKEIFCFFRDDHLSDKIGFEYSSWNGRDAANDFVQYLEHIWHATDPDVDPVVSVILDGENAWEYYPYNGYYFFTDLYSILEKHPFIRMATFSDCLINLGEENSAIRPGNLKEFVAGSWVYGTFSTWIGSPDKNKGWDLLCEAKESYDLVMASDRLSAEERELAQKQLADCEGSDWFWWFGDYNSAISVASFDSLYRRNLANLYKLLKLPVPSALEHVISVGGGEPAQGGTMRRSDGN